MKRNEYFKRALELYDSGQVSGEVYDAMIMNADCFCDEDDEEDEEDGYGLPRTYARLDFSPQAFEKAIAISVLPTPGTSSNSTFPLARMAAITFSMQSSLPIITFFTSSMTK